jgi:hypothetical protein
MEDFPKMILKKRKTFLHCIGLSENKNAHLKLIDILNHLKTVFKDNPKQFENLILSTDDCDETILHSYCENQEISNLEKMLQKIIECCDENLPKTRLEDFLLARDNDNKSFLHTLLERTEKKDRKDEKSRSDKQKGYYQIFCKNVIQLHETIDNKEKLKYLLEQKYKESLNLVEFVTENCRDIGFFIDWLKQHPEYPAPSKQLDQLELSDSSTSLDGIEQSTSRNPLENTDDEMAIKTSEENQIEASGQLENISIHKTSS